MILVDDLVAVDELTVHCRVTPSRTDLFFDEAKNGVPGYVGIEYMAQTIGGWSGYHAWLKGEVSPIGFLLGSRRYQAHCHQFECDVMLDVYGEKVMENNGMAVFSCRIEQNGTLLATSQLNVFVPSQDKLDEMLK